MLFSTLMGFASHTETGVGNIVASKYGAYNEVILPPLAPRIQCWSCGPFFPKVRIFAPLEEMLPVRIRVQPFNNTPCQTTWNGPSSKKEKRTDAFQDKGSQLRTGEGQKFATPDRAFFSGARPPAPRFQCCCSVGNVLSFFYP